MTNPASHAGLGAAVTSASRFSLCAADKCPTPAFSASPSLLLKNLFTSALICGTIPQIIASCAFSKHWLLPSWAISAYYYWHREESMHGN